MAEMLVNELTVNRPIDEAWPIICDLEAIAPCLPGAQLEEIAGAVHRGSVKIKLGAITAQFRGDAEIVARDDDAHTATLVAKGRDAGGRGNAEAVITASAEGISPTSTKINVATELQISGKVAQFGRGIMGEVSKKLMDQFAANLNTMLDQQARSPGASGDATTTAPPGVRTISAPAVEPIDVAGLAGPALAKRFAPVAVVAILLLVLLRLRRR